MEERFMAYSLVKKSPLANKKVLIELLQKAVEPKDRTRGKKHQVWKAGFDVKPCRIEKFLIQKLNYIHDIPLVENGTWQSIMRHMNTHLVYTISKKIQRNCQVIH